MKSDMNKGIAPIQEYPDKTTYYSYSMAKERFETIKRKKILLSEAILLLLYAQPDNPIYGRISLMKQVYLLIHELLGSEEVQNGGFVPYYYGWYSFKVINHLKNLQFLGYVERKGRRNTKSEQFRISEKGKERIRKLFSSLPEELQGTIREKRKGWDQLGCQGILNYTYAKYPESIQKSRLKERYKPIKWGRSRA